jgi:hypothetical protein
MQKVHFSLGDVSISGSISANETENVTIIVAFAHSVISASLAARAQAHPSLRSIVSVMSFDAFDYFPTLDPPAAASGITIKGGVSSETPFQPLPFSKVVLASWPSGANSLSLAFSLDLSAYNTLPIGQSYSLFLFSNYSSGWLRVPRDRTFTSCVPSVSTRTQGRSCRLSANLSDPGAYALISELDDNDVPASALMSDPSVYNQNTSAVVWGALCSGLVCLAVVYFFMRRRYSSRFPWLFCSKPPPESLKAPDSSTPIKAPICEADPSPPAKPLPPLPPDAFTPFQILPSTSMIPRPPDAPAPTNALNHRRRAVASLKPLPPPVLSAPPSLDSVIAVLDEAQLRDAAAAAAPRPAVLKVSQGIRRKKKNDLSAVVAKEAADLPAPPCLAHEIADVDLFIPSLQELGLAPEQDSGNTENCNQHDPPAEVVFNVDEVIVASAPPPPPVSDEAAPLSPPAPVRMSPVLFQEIEQLPDAPSGHDVQTGGKLFSKKKKEKREKRAKAPVPGMRADEEVPEWMRVQKQQQASSVDIPSVSMGCIGATADSNLEWAMIRKLKAEKDEDKVVEKPQVPDPSSGILMLPSASETAALASDSALEGWTMVRKIVSPSPLHPPPAVLQRENLLEISDGSGVIFGSQDVEGGFFVRRRAGVGKARGVADTSMDVEDFDG